MENLGAWVDAGDLEPGMWLRTSAGTYVQVSAIKAGARHHQRVHNLTVDGPHTYHVAAADEASLLVHNAGCPPIGAEGTRTSKDRRPLKRTSSGVTCRRTRFGEPRYLLRQRFGEHRAFRRTPAANLTDFYVGRGLFLSFTDDDRLEFIELVAPAMVVFRGIQLLGRPYGTGLCSPSLTSGGSEASPTTPGPSSPTLVSVSSRRCQKSAPSRWRPLAWFPGKSTVGEISTEIDYEIIPFTGIGLANLGDDRSEIRDVLGRCASECSPLGRVVRDHYWDHGLVLTFDGEEKLVRIAIMEPAEARFDGIKLLGRPYEAVLGDLQGKGHEVAEREAEIYLPKLGFGAWTSRHGNPSLPVSAVVIYGSRP